MSTTITISNAILCNVLFRRFIQAWHVTLNTSIYAFGILKLSSYNRHEFKKVSWVWDWDSWAAWNLRLPFCNGDSIHRHKCTDQEDHSVPQPLEYPNVMQEVASLKHRQFPRSKPPNLEVWSEYELCNTVLPPLFASLMTFQIYHIQNLTPI
jgi:hypothetical protein